MKRIVRAFQVGQCQAAQGGGGRPERYEELLYEGYGTGGVAEAESNFSPVPPWGFDG